jgi:hypothetical protein
LNFQSVGIEGDLLEFAYFIKQVQNKEVLFGYAIK